MYRALFLLFSSCAWWLCPTNLSFAEVVDSEAWINEVHYDNDGADQNEFVEVVAPSSWQDVSDLSLTLYNGSNGSAYGGPVALSDFTPGETVEGFTFYSHELTMQNGGPDGLALSRGTNVLQFLSYEGTFTATDGPAQGLLSTDMGVEEPSTTPLGWSLQLAGVGDSYLDFAWQGPLLSSVGGLNSGQSGVPEPASLIMWLVFAGSPLVFYRRWRPKRSLAGTVDDELGQ